MSTSSGTVNPYLAFNIGMGAYLDTPSEETLEHLLDAGELLVREVRRMHTEYRLPEPFDREVVLEALPLLVEQMHRARPSKFLQSFALRKMKRLVELTRSTRCDTIEVFRIVDDPMVGLLLEELLTEVLQTCPLRVRSALLYLLYYPERLSMVQNIPLTFAERMVLFRAIFLLKTKGGRRSVTLDLASVGMFTLPTTHIARVLLVSCLYKLSPAALASVFLTHDLNHLFQLCLLFGGTTVYFPTLDEVQHAMTNASTLAQRMEEEKTTVGDRESLALLAMDMSELTVPTTEELATLNPVLSAFFARMFENTLENYERLQRKLVESLDVSNPEEVSLVYETLNREMKTQVGLMQSIALSVEGVTEFRELIHTLTATREEGLTHPTVN